MESVQIRSFFSSLFSRIRTEYGEVLSGNAGKYGPEKTPYLDTFHMHSSLIHMLEYGKIIRKRERDKIHSHV